MSATRDHRDNQERGVLLVPLPPEAMRASPAENALLRILEADAVQRHIVSRNVQDTGASNGNNIAHLARIAQTLLAAIFAHFPPLLTTLGQSFCALLDILRGAIILLLFGAVARHYDSDDYVEQSPGYKPHLPKTISELEDLMTFYGVDGNASWCIRQALLLSFGQSREQDAAKHLYIWQARLLWREYQVCLYYRGDGITILICHID